jgi:hypothetical protein
MEGSHMSAVTTPIDMFITLFAVAISVGHLSMMFFGDSFFSSFGERWFVGAPIGFTFFVVWNSYKSNAIDFIAQGKWWLIIPVIIGLLSFTRLTKYRWAARYPVAALSGIGLGVFFGFNLRGSILAIITSTVDELITLQPDPFSAIVSFIAVVSLSLTQRETLLRDAPRSTIYDGLFRLSPWIRRCCVWLRNIDKLLYRCNQATS